MVPPAIVETSSVLFLSHCRCATSPITLADEILSRASPEANLWAARRANARAVRNEYTAALKAHDVRGGGYAACTDEAYRRLFDGPARLLRQIRGLPRGANVRDSMNLVELSTISLTEALAAERIEEEVCRGNKECQQATGRTATNVRRVIDLERADRQTRLLP